MAVITLSRQEGAGGDQLASRLAKILKYRLVDKELLVTVAAMAHAPIEQVERFAEGRVSRLERFLHGLVRALPNLDEYYRAYATVPLDDAERLKHYVFYGHQEGQADFSHLSRADCLRFFESAIRDLADRGKVIVVGRGSQVLLADFPHALHVRVVASEAFRAGAIARDRAMSEDEAAEVARDVEEHRADYLAANYDRDVNDPALYDFVVRTDKLAVDDVAAFVRKWVVQETARHEAQLEGDRPGD